jgi:hypothetical protein
MIPGAPVPKSSELLMATLENGAFTIDRLGPVLLRSINTGALAYAPCISADGLELYFTRASLRKTASGTFAPSVRILVATRTSTSSSFDEPQLLANLTGVVEAPTLSLDQSELFFHKREGGTYAIYRARRKPGKTAHHRTDR